MHSHPFKALPVAVERVDELQRVLLQVGDVLGLIPKQQAIRHRDDLVERRRSVLLVLHEIQGLRIVVVGRVIVQLLAIVKRGLPPLIG